MSDDLEPIHVSESLRNALHKRKATLSQTVTMLAERYASIITSVSYSEHYPIPMMDYHAELYDNTVRHILKGEKRPLTVDEIKMFPAHVEAWLKEHQEFPQGPGGTALMIVKKCKYPELVALIDCVERFT